jgi:hypothetical protein
MIVNSQTFHTTLKGKPISFEVRSVTIDGQPWLSMFDVCFAADIFLKRDKDYPTVDSTDVKANSPAGSWRLIKGIQKRGPGLIMLRRDAVERILELSFRHYADEFKAWITETFYTVRTEFMNDWLAARGLNWSLAKCQRFGVMATFRAQKLGVKLTHKATAVVSGGKLVDTRLVEWPIGFLDQALSEFSGQ